MNEQSKQTFSIVTPSFKQGRFIEETIKSVISQAGDFYIDYIIADAGSTDNTMEIVKKYEQLLSSGQYPIKCKGINFRYWSKKDKGQSDAINQGFKLATGDLVAWINSDDYYEPDVFDYIMKKFKENPDIDLFYGEIYFVYDIEGKKVHKKTQQGSREEFFNLTEKGWYIYQPSTFFTKRIINEVGLLDETLNYAFDYEFFIRIFKKGKALYCPKILSSFRIWEQSKTFSQQEKFKIEKKIIHKRHGLIRVNPKAIYRLTSHFPFSSLRTKTPRFYKFCKNIVYCVINKTRYKNNL